jgi:hypothetical protein
VRWFLAGLLIANSAATFAGIDPSRRFVAIGSLTVKSLIVFSLMLAGVLGSWSPEAGPWQDARPEAIVTGTMLLMLAAALRHGLAGRRTK